MPVAGFRHPPAVRRRVVALAGLVLWTAFVPHSSAAGDCVEINLVEIHQVLSSADQILRSTVNRPILTLCENAVLLESEGGTFLYREDLAKLRILNPGPHWNRNAQPGTYVELPLPVRLEDHLPDSGRSLDGCLKGINRAEAATSRREATDSWKGWRVSENRLRVEIPRLGTEIVIRELASDELAINPRIYRRFTRSLDELDLGVREWADERAELRGFPVWMEETLTVDRIKRRTITEVESTRPVPMPDWTLPDSLRRVGFVPPGVLGSCAGAF